MNKSTVELPHSTLEEAATFLYVFNAVYPISAGSQKFLIENTYPIKVRKGKKMHKAGEICDIIYFVNKGAIRGFCCYGNDGNQYFKRFSGSLRI